METKTREAAVTHAIATYPQESCGLVVVFKGKERYIACRNLAESKDDQFVMSPEDYAAAEDMGEITAIVHSHPDYPSEPSEADRVSCEASGLPWYILAIHRQDDSSLKFISESAITPCGFEAPLIGRTFVHGVLDCYTLVCDWYKRELGIELPHYEREDEWWNKGQDLYLEHYQKHGFERISGEPQVGDVILMQVRAPKVNHAGVYIGDGQFIHHFYGRLSSRDVYSGYWQEVTRMIVRKKKDE